MKVLRIDEATLGGEGWNRPLEKVVSSSLEPWATTVEDDAPIGLSKNSKGKMVYNPGMGEVKEPPVLTEEPKKSWPYVGARAFYTGMNGRILEGEIVEVFAYTLRIRLPDERVEWNYNTGWLREFP